VPGAIDIRPIFASEGPQVGRARPTSLQLEYSTPSRPTRLLLIITFTPASTTKVNR